MKDHTMEILNGICIVLFLFNAIYALIVYTDDPKKKWSNMSACLGWFCAILMGLQIFL